MQSQDQVDLTPDLSDLLPKVVIDEWLPDENQSILFLFYGFNNYPPHPIQYTLPSNFQSALHQTPVQEFDFKYLLQIPPALPDISQAYQDVIKKSKFPILSVTLQSQLSDPITLPVWVFDYWREIGRVVGIRKQWKVALTWIRGYSISPPASALCSTLLFGLSSFSWSHGAAYSNDITPLLLDSSSESFLNSFHIDHMIGQFKSQYQAQHGLNHTNLHIFATVDHLNAIMEFYGPVHKKKEGYLWDALMTIENKIVTGEVHSFGGVMHLPLHWVSVVIDFQQMKILYGDSLGHQMPRRKFQTYERWMNHLIRRSSKLPVGGEIVLGQLSTGQQLDGNSCGLFALNSIAHHYLQTPLLPSDPIALACRRMEIALNIINTMTVCMLYSVQVNKTHNIL